ncbi:hypothetical protein EDC44_10510 [Cricetibacter osteomyelitidis]|uniref:Uncharacterized protein n=1 Tax=Cricetibacter osteomyelitidis TaxID=1521931 RepID=A0A4R2T3X9_9PAST|nr:retron St85 family effector protein [Cricetibacter osteomyelitidis]TCP96191.1 hypothetical protein EDC44_10510 [Cricetibacter osteomyelitidis]
MNKNKYEDILIDLYGSYELKQFIVQLSEQKIFVCGGYVDIKNPPPNSFREYFFERAASSNPELESLLIMAESFKDYLQDGLYNDLLTFETDIAHISALIIIFLESPGSLVELGLFSNKSDFYNKLLIITPNTESKDSFIYLGPLTHIKRKNDKLVLSYPFPKKGIDFDQSHVDDIISCTKEILSKLDKTQKFDSNNITHIIFLICEIVRLSYPIILTEIEFSLAALYIDLTQTEVKRFLYLLDKLEYINVYDYSSYKFYYPSSNYKDKCFVKFGKNNEGTKFDESKHKMKLRESYMQSNDDIARKRKSALKYIMKEHRS